MEQFSSGRRSLEFVKTVFVPMKLFEILEIGASYSAKKYVFAWDHFCLGPILVVNITFCMQKLMAMLIRTFILLQL